MNGTHPLKKRALVVMISALMGEHVAYAGGFSLYTESSAAAVGNFAAGVAAEAYDASTNWYNPAGLVWLHKQEAIISGVGVLPKTRLTGTSIFETVDYPPYQQSFQNEQGAENALVPALHYAQPLGERAAFGVSLISPFGLATDWDSTSPLRYSATRTELTLVNLTPAISGLLTDHVSVGLGLDLQWARVTFNSVLGSPAELQYLESIGGLVTPTTLDSTSQNKGTSFGFGFHAGLLGSYHEGKTRWGVNYQSGVGHEFQGSSTLTGRLADPELTNPAAVFYTDGLYSNHVELPQIVTLSGYQTINSRIDLLGSLVYTGWDSYKTVTLNNIAAASTDGPTLVDLSTAENFRNTWRAALGLNYHVKDNVMMRLGGGYDQTPTVNSAREIRLPDSSRWALSVGTHYQWRPQLGVDVGYTYLFGLGQAPVNKTIILGENSTNTIVANAKSHAQLVGLQVVWTV